jgi:hypothetical protein
VEKVAFFRGKEMLRHGAIRMEAFGKFSQKSVGEFRRDCVIRRKKKSVVFPVTRPTHFYGRDPNIFVKKFY